MSELIINTNTAFFKYQALPSRRTIRLIKFLPGITPACEMFSVEVDKAPPYAALSYTWGSKSLDRKLQVDGHHIQITQNLAEAINDVFKYVREARLAFWADSICINQDDISERGKQVQLMRTIYRSAEIVTIWLGPVQDDSDLVFEKMKEWKTKVDILKQQHGDSIELAMASIDTEDSFFFGPHGSQAHRLQEAFQKICLRNWWKRAWIVPEGTVASSTRTLLFCGSHMIDWESLRAALKIFHHVGRGREEGLFPYLEDLMASRLDQFRINRESGALVRLLEVLQTMRSYECEDPRDKVYASLGMAMDVVEEDIIPDYTKTCAEVYGEVVRFSLSSTQSLDFLGYVLKSSPGSVFEYNFEEALPSWIPDWRFQVSFLPLEKDLSTNSFVKKRAYDAGGSVPYEVDNHRFSRLMLKGSALDHITRVWTICERNISGGGLSCERSWIPSEPESKYTTGGTLMEAYNHTLLADIGRRNYEKDGELTRGCAVDWELLDMDYRDMTALERHRQSWMLIDVKMMTFGRRLFQTSRGFIGLGPAACDLNDNVCVLFGGQVLYALREQSSVDYEFIGECYVHGMMDGQALKDESFSVKDFIIT